MDVIFTLGLMMILGYDWWLMMLMIDDWRLMILMIMMMMMMMMMNWSSPAAINLAIILEFFFGVWVSKGSRASPPKKRKSMYPSLFGHVLGISAHLKNHVVLYPLNYTNLCTKSPGQFFRFLVLHSLELDSNRQFATNFYSEIVV